LKKLHVSAESTGAVAITYGKGVNTGLVYYSYRRLIRVSDWWNERSLWIIVIYIVIGV